MTGYHTYHLVANKTFCFTASRLSHDTDNPSHARRNETRGKREDISCNLFPDTLENLSRTVATASVLTIVPQTRKTSSFGRER